MIVKGLERRNKANIELKDNAIILKNPKAFDLKEYITNIQLSDDVTVETYRVLEDILSKIEKE